MGKNTLNKLNIDNLTQLWRTLGSQKVTEYGYQSDSWPHRVWVPWNEFHKTDHASHLISSEASGLFPVWNSQSHYSQSMVSRLQDSGAAMYLQQMAMYIDLNNYDSTPNCPLQIEKISNSEDITTWCDIVEKSFGYSVSKEVFNNIVDHPDVHLFLGMDEDKPVATSLLYKTGDVMGLHQVGVLPSVRKKDLRLQLPPACSITLKN